jgi:hypothetical protein
MFCQVNSKPENYQRSTKSFFLSFCFCFFFHGVKLGHDTRPGVPTIFPRRLALLYRTRVSLSGHFKWALQNPQARFTSLIQRSIAILFHITRQHVPLFVPQSLGFITVKMRIMCACIPFLA